MNFSESMNVVHSRIHQLEPENVTKIIGYLLLTQQHCDRDMIRLAFCPDAVLHSVINTVKYELVKNADKFGSSSSTQSLSPPDFPVRTGFWENHQEIAEIETGVQSLNFDDFSGSFFSQEQPVRTSRRSPSLPEFPVKVCHYYLKGFCKHGINCRYFHGEMMPEREMFGQSEEEHVVSAGSLEKLEGEIIELLKSRRGVPISIASLPIMYLDKYGKTLQAEGYLTESQRHGKAGYSLTKLLARLKNTIRLIDKPHGQHSVILAEDVSKFVDYSENGAILAGSRQIYLTFPAESNFTENDVSNYFSKFGPVEDVRIPCQQKRMFGFVTFVYAETVKHILNKGNPHFICGARVLVKPYREKLRRYPENKLLLQPLRYASPLFIERDIETSLPPPRMVCESSRLMKKQFMQEHEHLVSKSLPKNYSYLGFSSNDLLTADEEEQEEHARRLDCLLDYLNTDPTTEDNLINDLTTNYKDNERNLGSVSKEYFNDVTSQVLNLPESPFSLLSGTEISTVT